MSCSRCRRLSTSFKLQERRKRSGELSPFPMAERDTVCKGGRLASAVHAGHSPGDRDALLLPLLDSKGRHPRRIKMHPKDSEGFNMMRIWPGGELHLATSSHPIFP